MSEEAVVFDFKRFKRAGEGAGRQGPAGASLGKLFDRLPPHSPEAEMSLLGSLILDPKVTPEVIGLVKSGESFYSAAHGAIFDGLLRLYDAHQSGDLVQLVDQLKDRGLLEDVGGSEYLLQLGESVPSAANAVHYARIVAEKAKLRNLIDAAGQMLYEAYHSGDLGPDGARSVLDKAEQLIFEIAEETDSGEASALKELLHEAMELMEANEGRTVTGIATGFDKLDEMTSGFQGGEMIIVAARPSMGKTAFALNLAEQIALRHQPTVAEEGKRHAAGAAPVAIFSLEMGKQSVAQRMMCARAGVDSHRMRTGRLGADDYKQILSACGELGEAPLYIDDTPGMTILQLRARTRRMVAQYGVKCIIIDYLQLLSAPSASRESRQNEVSSISRGIKALARELKIPVVCLAQLNRGSEQREGHRPRMSDLRESGSIEQDADVVMLLHREEYYHQGDPEWLEMNPQKEGIAELIIAKQRNGPTGIVELVWDERTTRFKNFAGRGYQAEYVEAGPPVDAQAPSRAAGSAFAGRPRSGPVNDHRDGGGPDQSWKNEDIDDLPI